MFSLFFIKILTLFKVNCDRVHPSASLIANLNWCAKHQISLTYGSSFLNKHQISLIYVLFFLIKVIIPILYWCSMKLHQMLNTQFLLQWIAALRKQKTSMHSLHADHLSYKLVLKNITLRNIQSYNSRSKSFHRTTILTKQ